MDPSRFAEGRNRVLGDPLAEEEVGELVERYRHSDCARQINLGKFNQRNALAERISLIDLRSGFVQIYTAPSLYFYFDDIYREVFEF